MQLIFLGVLMLDSASTDMTALYKKYLDEWESDSKVRAVLVESSSSRAFSAGYSSFTLNPKTVDVCGSWHPNGEFLRSTQ